MAQQLGSNYYNSPFKFNGKELDEETGFYYYGARYYDPKISIWLSTDPLAEKFPNFNPYNYVMQNPLNLTDPTGMAPEEGGATDPPKGGSPIVSLGTGKEVVVVGKAKYKTSNSWSTEFYHGDWYDYSMTTESYNKKYGAGASGNYTQDDYKKFIQWQSQMDRYAMKQQAADWFQNLGYFMDASEDALNLASGNGLAKSFTSWRNAGRKSFSYVPRHTTTQGDKVFLVTKEGVVLPKGAKIPKEFVESPFRSSNYGIFKDGKFIEKLRIDPPTPAGMKGPNFSHYHLNGKSKHLTKIGLGIK